MGVSGNKIDAAGVYTPRYRIDADAFDAIGGFEARGVNSKSVAAGDEDSTTMAIEAAEKALSAAEIDRDAVGNLIVATTTPPVEEFDISATIAEVLGLSPDVRMAVHAQSTVAGTRALRDGFDTGRPTIVVAADHPQSSPMNQNDHAAGAGAVAFVLSSEGDVEIQESTTHTEEYPGTRFRQFGSDSVETYDATAYERRAFTEPVAAAVGELQNPAKEVAISAPNGSLPYRATRQFGFDADVHQAASDLGDLGAAGALVSLVRAWNDDADRVTVVGYGDGASVDAFVLEGKVTVSMDRTTEQIEYGEYLRKRGHIGLATGGDN
jgi:hydroxymethylglutaryl-CoA synthase